MCFGLGPSLQPFYQKQLQSGGPSPKPGQVDQPPQGPAQARAAVEGRALTESVGGRSFICLFPLV